MTKIQIKTMSAQTYYLKVIILQKLQKLKEHLINLFNFFVKIKSDLCLLNTHGVV